MLWAAVHSKVCVALTGIAFGSIFVFAWAKIASRHMPEQSPDHISGDWGD